MTHDPFAFEAPFVEMAQVRFDANTWNPLEVKECADAASLAGAVVVRDNDSDRVAFIAVSPHEYLRLRALASRPLTEP